MSTSTNYENKLKEMEQIIARQEKELSQLRKAAAEWSPEHILCAYEDAWELSSAQTRDIETRKLSAKYEIARKIETIKSDFERDVQ